MKIIFSVDNMILAEIRIRLGSINFAHGVLKISSYLGSVLGSEKQSGRF
jgi:hypothetical protein